MGPESILSHVHSVETPEKLRSGASLFGYNRKTSNKIICQLMMLSLVESNEQPHVQNVDLKVIKVSLLFSHL